MIDTETLILSSMLVSAFFCGAFFIYSLEQRTYQGFKIWAFSALIMTLGFLAIILRGTLPIGVSIFAINGLFILAAVLRLDAIRRFLVDRSVPGFIYTIPIAVALSGIVFYSVSDRIDIRTLIVSVALFILSVSISWNLVRNAPRENRLLYYSAGIFIALRGLTLLARAVFGNADSHHILGDTMWSLIQLEFGLISEVGQNVFFLMMNSKRAEVNSKTSELKLNATVIDLKKALSEVTKLQGILPICSHCKKIRDDQGSWQGIEHYVRERSDAQFSHGICPECAKEHYPGVDVYGGNE